MSQAKRLGMGLGALIGGFEKDTAPAPVPIRPADPSGTVAVALIRPNPYQPRTEFDDKEIASLAESLKKQGLIQPVVVRPAAAGFYELVAGERRLRASKLAGLDKIPAIIRPVDDQKMLELALVENLQRKDLNPMEKARAFKALMTLNAWTQDLLADAVGLGRPTVSNFMRLLEAPPEVQEAVSRGTITMGHARALLSISQKATMLNLLKRIIENDLSVREVEQSLAKKPALALVKSDGKRSPHLQELEQKLMDKVGVKVEIQPDAIRIPYDGNKQLSDILHRLGVI